MATKESDAQVSSKKEFAELALDGHNFPTWAMDLKVSLSLRGMYRAIDTPKQGDAPLSEPSKYHALYIIRNHIHSDLIVEYLMEEDPQALVLLCNSSMSNKRQLFSRRPLMSGTTSTFKISNL